jgi:hypothetical protein
MPGAVHLAAGGVTRNQVRLPHIRRLFHTLRTGRVWGLTAQENGPFPAGTGRDMEIWTGGRRRPAFQAVASRPAPLSEVMAGPSGRDLPSAA